MTQLILDHPLYPLLQMVFQKCELATSSPRDAQAETIGSSDSFGEDIRNFISQSRVRNLPLTTGVHDVDAFMLKSIEVLRIHLLELEKVHQLCDNFCQRYINCLKGKLPIDLVVDDGSRDTNSASRNGNQQDGPSNNNSANNTSGTNNNTSSSNNNNNSSNNNSTSDSSNNNGHHHHHQNNASNGNNHNSANSNQSQQASNQLHSQHSHEVALAANGYPAAGGAANAPDPYHHAAAGSAYMTAGYAAAAAADHRMNPYAAAHAAYAASAGGPHYQAPADPQQQQQQQQQQAQHQQHQASSAKHDQHHQRELNVSSGSSSASSIKMEHEKNGHYEANSTATSAPDRQQLHDDVRSPTGSTGSFLGDASLGSGDGTECEDDDNRGRRQQKKRGIFPKAATNIMRAWLFQHLNHPYPSEDQKKSLSDETGLTILQVNNWFINARRRIVQPMIDQSNRTSGNIMAGPAYSPDAGMGYMLDSSQPFRSLPGVDSSGMGPLAASHAAMTSAMGAYSAASAQHLSQYGRSQQQHAAMLGLSTPPTGPHMMGAHPPLPPHDYY